MGTKLIMEGTTIITPYNNRLRIHNIMNNMVFISTRINSNNNIQMMVMISNNKYIMTSNNSNSNNKLQAR